jgi:hypothetical protein
VVVIDARLAWFLYWHTQRDDYDEYLSTGKLGGHEYDITKMSKAERQAASLGGGGLMFDSDDGEFEFV